MVEACAAQTKGLFARPRAVCAAGRRRRAARDRRLCHRGLGGRLPPRKRASATGSGPPSAPGRAGHGHAAGAEALHVPVTGPAAPWECWRSARRRSCCRCGPSSAGLLDALARTDGLAAGARAAGRGGRERPGRGRDRADAQLAAELGLSRPANAAGRDHGRATTLLEARRRSASDAPRADEDRSLDEAERLEPSGPQPARHDAARIGRAQLKREWQSAGGGRGLRAAPAGPALGEREVPIALPPDLPLVLRRRVLIEQVLVNLLENAVKYTPAGRADRVSAPRRPDGVERRVADDGPGLPPGQEERIFEKFFRAPTAAAARRRARARDLPRHRRRRTAAASRPRTAARGGASSASRCPSKGAARLARPRPARWAPT